MTNESDGKIERVVLSIIAALILIVCGVVFPRPSHQSVQLAILFVALLLLFYFVWGSRWQAIPKHGHRLRLFWSVIVPGTLCFVTLNMVSSLNQDLGRLLTADVSYVTTFALVLLFFLFQLVLRTPARSTFGLAATCIPIRYDKKEKCYIVTLVSNTHYSDEQWMFPGGHVRFTDNHRPHEIARSCARTEAGLDVELMHPTPECDTIYDHLKVLPPPHFNYLFRLNDTAQCRRTDGHEYHFDFTYVGHVERQMSVSHELATIDVKVPEDAVSEREVQSLLLMALTSYYKQKHTPMPAHLFPASIPQILADALQVYKDRPNNG